MYTIVHSSETMTVCKK